MKVQFVTTLFVLTSLVFPINAVAITSNESAGKIRENVIENVCERTTKRIEEQIKRWEGREPAKHKAYTNTVAEALSAMKRLKEKGFDTLSLENALQNLNDAVLKRHTDAQLLINLLKDTKLYACGKSEGQFKEAMLKVREQWKVVEEDTKEIRNIWQNQVRPEIRKLREQKKILTVTPTLTEVEQ